MMLKVFLFAPYVALASSFLLATIVSMICVSQSEVSLEANGFTLRKKVPLGKSRPRTSSPPPVKRAWRNAAA
jgi:hypothetical protein